LGRRRGAVSGFTDHQLHGNSDQNDEGEVVVLQLKKRDYRIFG
jgi:hypothetical protein